MWYFPFPSTGFNEQFMILYGLLHCAIYALWSMADLTLVSVDYDSTHWKINPCVCYFAMVELRIIWNEQNNCNPWLSDPWNRRMFDCSSLWLNHPLILYFPQIKIHHSWHGHSTFQQPDIIKVPSYVDPFFIFMLIRSSFFCN